MKALALLIDDRELYGVPRLFLLCVYSPAIVILVSWTLIRWKSWLVVAALTVAGIAVSMIVGDLRREFLRVDLLRQIQTKKAHFDNDYHPKSVATIDPEEIGAVTFAATFPFLAIGMIYLVERKKKPNPSPDPAAPSGRG
jgi:hypothetical protein